MSLPFPEPTIAIDSHTEVLLGYLAYFRSCVVDKLSALPEAHLRRSRLPSGWTPLELLEHLTFVELRWLEWGFEGLPVDDPWGDQRDGRWFVADDHGLNELTAALRMQAVRTRAVVEEHELTDIGAPGPRWEGADPPTLERVLLHLIQEYARHLGHLDIVVELATGSVGE